MIGTIQGHLIIIGGAEDKQGECVILKQAPAMLKDNDRMAILTTATEHAEEVGAEYLEVFHRLGIKNAEHLNMNTRDDANDAKMCEKISHAECIFLTGGDQLRITSILGGTRASEALRSLYYAGGLIMGTSAGASVMSSTMVVQGEDMEPARKCTLKMAPGFDLFHNTIIDQHFDQRGRFGRLLCGVAENPDVLGLGIDENTAVKVFPDHHFEILGQNAVTILDGRTIQSSNVSELKPHELLAIVGITVHTLPAGYGFDLQKRKVLRLN